MDSEQKNIRRFLYMPEIAHIVIENKAGVLAVLNQCGITYDDEMDENIVHLVYDHRMNPELNSSILKLLSANPYRNGCHSCWEKISETVEKVKNKKS